MANHIVDVLPICYHIVAIGRETIARGEYLEGTPERVNLQAILA